MNNDFEPRKVIDSEEWASFLPEFALRNNDRRARFEVYRADGSVDEEGQEMHLEDLEVVEHNGHYDVKVIRIERGEELAEKVEDHIEKVRGVAVQIETDGSEGAIEFVDGANELITLRMESRIDGVS
ncbi:MAG: hypothetical protein ACK5NT_07625 [Pyrinomonadaceae bacterium]